MSKTIFILLAVLAVQASATTVRECETGDDDFEATIISGCNASPCLFKRGDQVNVRARVQLELLDIAPNPLTQLVFMSFQNITIPGIDGESACGKISRADGSSAGCPLESGVAYVFADKIEIPDNAPLGPGTIRVSLKNGDEYILCFEVDVIISD